MDTTSTPDTARCPRCSAEMTTRVLGRDAEVTACPEGHGVFLSRADLGALVEAENDWHQHAGQHTAPLPRITPEMLASPSPAASTRPARAWVETLFE